MDNGSPLKTSQKLELLIVVLQHRPLRPILDTFDSGQLVEVHSFIWDKLVELHYLTQDSEFEREIVTRQMVPSAEYQKQQNCDLA